MGYNIPDPTDPSQRPTGVPGRDPGDESLGGSDSGRPPSGPSRLQQRWQAGRDQWAANAAAGRAGIAGIQSAVRPEIENSMMNDPGPGYAHADPGMYERSVREARQGRYDTTDYPGEPGVGAAYTQLQQDFDPWRQARAKFQEARTDMRSGDPTDPVNRGDVRNDRQDMLAERHLAMAGENRGLTQAELAARRPQRYARLMSRTDRGGSGR